MTDFRDDLPGESFDLYKIHHEKMSRHFQDIIYLFLDTVENTEENRLLDIYSFLCALFDLYAILLANLIINTETKDKNIESVISVLDDLERHRRKIIFSSEFCRLAFDRWLNGGGNGSVTIQ